ncbi:MAG: RNA-binding protein [Nitrospirae bacterium]|nr:RNA-binding protein [Nitrospirota bacterium]
MGKKLYVGSISFNASEEDLIKLFSTIGEVESAKIITDANTGQSKGFAFIEMASEEDAKKAITDLNGSSFMERAIVVNEARPKAPREKRDFGGAGRGGFDRGRGGAGGFGNSRGGRGSAGPGRKGRR